MRRFFSSLSGRDGGEPSKYTLAGYFTLIRAVFKFAAKRRFIKPEMDPTFSMERYDTGTTDEPEVLTLADALALLKWTAGSATWRDLLPTVVLGLLCGIRAAERSRIKWSDSRPGGRDEIYLSRAITKTNTARVLPISPALAEWLDYFRRTGFSMEPDEHVVPTRGTGHFSRYNRLTNFAVAVHQAGLRMPKNALRHTAASNLCVVLGRSRAADILGHSEKMLVRHHRRAMLPEDAEKMLGITPSQLGL